jgi:cytosine deaminase
MLLLRNALLEDRRHVDVHVGDDGMIAAVIAAGSPIPPGATVHDLDGWLLLPAMAELHAHLDKALTAERIPNPSGDLIGAIEAWVSAAQAGRLTVADMVERATAALDLLLVHGVTAVRSHVNVGEGIGASSIEALVGVKRRFADLVDLQLVALTHSPMTGPGSDANRAALADAVALGVDVVGGCPHLEPDGPAAIVHALEVAAAAGLPVDLHVDETLDPAMLQLVDLAHLVRERRFPQRVTASHCVSLGVQPLERQREVADAVAAAGVAVAVLPQTNLFLQGRDHPTSTPRGLTPVSVLREAGVLVGAGADNVQDPFNLVGRSDPLETAALLVMAGHQLPEQAYQMVSNTVRVAMGLAPITMTVGDPADLLAIDAPSVRAAIADAPMSRRVYRRGRLVARCDETAHVLR